MGNRFDLDRGFQSEANDLDRGPRRTIGANPIIAVHAEIIKTAGAEKRD